MTEPADSHLSFSCPPASLVVLTGFRATGKTAVGKEIAERLGYRFADTDDLITARLGCSIADAVQQDGWQRFRTLEKKVLAECVRLSKTVLATGGGAVCHGQAWAALRSHALVIWLRAGEATIISRLQADMQTQAQRPPLTKQTPVTDISELLTEREPLYRAGADIQIQTDGRTPQQLAALLVHDIQDNRSPDTR